MTDTLLVSTYHSLLRVDPSTGRRDVVHRGLGVYYGITWTADTLVVAARCHPWYMPTGHRERPTKLVLDRKLEATSIERLPADAGGIHQISYIGSEIYYACSRADAYLIEKDNSFSFWMPSPDPNDHGRDAHHFNSIWSDGEHLYLIGHNLGPSEIWVFDLKTRTLIDRRPIGCCAHNVWRHEGNLTVCNSRSGRIENEHGEVLAETGGFPRGVAVTDTHIYVGVSGRAHRLVRWVGRSELLVFDRSWRLLNRIYLGHNGGVNEVRVLNRQDHAHNAQPFWTEADACG